MTKTETQATEVVPAQEEIQVKRKPDNLILQVHYDENGVARSQNGKVLGRPKKVENVQLSKADIRSLYERAFDLNAPQLFTKLMELALTDKDILKFVVEQRIGKAAQVVSGDEQSPITVVVRRGIENAL